MPQHEHDPFSPHDSVPEKAKRARKAPSSPDDDSGPDEGAQDDSEE